MDAATRNEYVTLQLLVLFQDSVSSPQAVEVLKKAFVILDVTCETMGQFKDAHSGYALWSLYTYSTSPSSSSQQRKTWGMGPG